MSAQSMEALEIANEIRMQRARLKVGIKDRHTSVAAFLSEPLPGWAKGMHLKELLGAEPRMGTKRMGRLLDEAGVTPFGVHTRLGNLTGRQRRYLIELLVEKAARVESRAKYRHPKIEGLR